MACWRVWSRSGTPWSPRPPPRPPKKPRPRPPPPRPTAAALAVLGGGRRPRVREVRRRARLVDDVGLAPEDDRDAALARALLLR